jgi:hypothetical protein
MKRTTGGWVTAGAAWLAVGLGGGMGLAGPARSPGPAALGLLDPSSAPALAGNLRSFLLEALPDPLFEDAKQWGTQAPVRRLKWRGQGLGVHPEVQEVLENDGSWWKVRVTAISPRDSLVVDLRDVQHPEPGRMTFTAFVALDAHVDYDRQKWRSGKRLYSGSTRARMRLKLEMRCEVTGRLDTKGLLPEAVVRLRVVDSRAGYENFVVEHIPGLGGEAAKVLGNAAHASLQQWHPSLERQLIARANAAILKAGDSKEVRVGLASLLGKKDSPPAPAKPARPTPP